MAVRNLPPSTSALKLSRNQDPLLETAEQIIAFISQDEAFNGLKTTILRDNVTLLAQDELRVMVVPPAVWSDKSVMARIEAHPDAFVVMLSNDENDHDQLEGILSAPSALPGWMATAAVHSLHLPATTASCRSVFTGIQRFHNVVLKTRHDRDEHRLDAENVKYIMSISRELNGERDIPRLLNLILLKAREVTGADAGSIYTIETAATLTTSPTKGAVNAAQGNIESLKGGNRKPQDDQLHFRFTQNHSVKQNLSEFKLPINRNSIVGNVVLNQTTINIPDLYLLSEDPAQNPFNIRHDKSWDKRIGYQSRSMLTLPMFDISHQVIGVIQLINCKRDPAQRLLTPEDFEKYVTPFDERAVQYVEIVAQQAGIALENARMTEEIQTLFDGLVEASVTAIEQRDPTTSGHSHRVAALTTELARVVDRNTAGHYGNINFNEDEMREIRYASLLHDFGKLGVREAVLVKAKKLFPQDLELILERFNLVRASYEIDYLRGLLNLMQRPDLAALGVSGEQLLEDRNNRFRMLDEFIGFIMRANEPTVLEQGGFDRLKDIANLRFKDINEHERQLLKDQELKALSVSRGSLTSEEYAEIQSHVVHTYDFLRKIPWGKKLAHVPQIAAKHHEKLDGSGYPTSAMAEEIPIQSRMMTIADIYDALSASDRPYKRSLPPEKAIEILEMEVRGGKIDQELFRLFVESKAYLVVQTGTPGGPKRG
ncbi:MAG: hypothetical protein RIQ81_1571 [Pseudomonadota bacterium]|jgi:HD-GYP domain-containing protein (c-di-GMP phosphodiesterase class II)